MKNSLSYRQTEQQIQILTFRAAFNQTESKNWTLSTSAVTLTFRISFLSTGSRTKSHWNWDMQSTRTLPTDFQLADSSRSADERCVVGTTTALTVWPDKLLLPRNRTRLWRRVERRRTSMNIRRNTQNYQHAPTEGVRLHYETCQRVTETSDSRSDKWWSTNSRWLYWSGLFWFSFPSYAEKQIKWIII